jgi:hypothetical protein
MPFIHSVALVHSTWILPYQHIQTNPYTIRINIRIQTPRNKQINSTLSARITIRPANCLVPIFERGSCV